MNRIVIPATIILCTAGLFYQLRQENIIGGKSNKTEQRRIERIQEEPVKSYNPSTTSYTR